MRMRTSRWVAVPVLSLFTALLAGSAPAIGIHACFDSNGDEIPCLTKPPPKVDGGAAAPGADPRVATCQAAPQGNLPPDCATVLATEIQRQRTTAGTPTRGMFHADPQPYPANFGTTVSTNLLPHVGVVGTGDPAAPKLVTSTELTYYSILSHDWASAKGGSLAPPVSGNFAPHPWSPGATTGIGAGRATSCEEWTYKKYNVPVWQQGGASESEDYVAACGSDGMCGVSALLGLNRVFSFGTPTIAVGTTPVRANPNIPIAWLKDAARPKNPFYAVSSLITFDQSTIMASKLRDAGSGYCHDALGGPYMPGGAYWFSPTRYNGSRSIGSLNAELATAPVYLIGNAPAPAGSRVIGNFANEVGFLTGIGWTRFNDTPQVIAMRERVAHLRDLMQQFTELTTITCGSSGSGGSGGGSGGGGDGSGGGVGSGNGGGGCGQTGCGQGGGGPHGHPITAPTPASATDTIGAVADLQDQIVSFMLAELDRGDDGCFGPNQSACDIDPFEVTGRLLSSLRAPEEADFQACVTWTGNPTWPAGPSLDSIDTLIATKIADAKKKLLNAPGIDPSVEPTAPLAAGPQIDAPTVHRDAVGQVITGSKYLGDPNFAGGGYSYGAYWKVTPSEFAGGTGPACRLDGEVHGELHGRVDLLKTIGDTFCGVVDGMLDSQANNGTAFNDGSLQSALKSGLGAAASALNLPIDQLASLCTMRYRMRHLADAYMTASATPDKVGYKGEVFFGGQQLWAPEGSTASPNVSASWPANPIHINGFSDTEIIVVVPVTFQVYGEIQYGAMGFARAGAIRNCGNPTLEAHAAFTPWISVDAIGSVGIGFSWAQVGVRGKVRVLDANLPLDTAVLIGKGPDGQLALMAHAHANLNVTLLSGSVSAFAEIGVSPFDEEVEKQIASWDGLKTTVPILNWELDPIRLPIFDKTTWDQFRTSTQAQ
jgi:hypothetical protein